MTTVPSFFGETSYHQRIAFKLLERVKIWPDDRVIMGRQEEGGNLDLVNLPNDVNVIKVVIAVVIEHWDHYLSIDIH